MWFWGLLAYPELYCDRSVHNQHSWNFRGVHGFLSLKVTNLPLTLSTGLNTSSHRILGRFLTKVAYIWGGLIITRIKPASKQAIQVLIKICFAIVIYQWKFISIYYFEEGFILQGQGGRGLIIRCTFLSTGGWAYNRAEGGALISSRL